MREFESKKKVHNIIYSKFTIIILLFIVLFLLGSLFNISKKTYISYRLMKEEKKILLSLDEKKALIQNDIKWYKSPLGEETLLRSRYSLTKPDEDTVIIINENDFVLEETTKNKSGIWTKLMNFIGFE